MTPIEIARMRLAAQQISAPKFRRPREVVAWFGAMQAQDYLASLWAVGLRLDGARESDVESALAKRTIVRTWPLRGTLHFVAAEDARWMIEVQSARRISGAAGRFRQLGLDRATLTRARRVAEKVLHGRPLTRPALYREFLRAKVSPEGARGLHLLWWLAHECVICFGARDGKQQTFVLFDDWLPRARSLPREEALAELARRYFRSHGPATVHDFAWWSGLSLREARQAVQLAGRALEEIDLGGRPLWLARGATAPRTTREAYLLPGFDELLVGYADRSALVEVSQLPRVNNGGGILSPVLVWDGRVIGTWKRGLAKRGLTFLPAPFKALEPSPRRALQQAVRRYAEFLGTDVVRGEWDGSLVVGRRGGRQQEEQQLADDDRQRDERIDK